MVKRTLASIVVLSFFMAPTIKACLASETLGTIGWHITNLTNMSNQPIEMQRDYLWLDVEIGNSFFLVYGTFMDNSGNNVEAAHGSGYTFVNDDGSGSIKMEVRAGTYIYKLDLDMNSLGGTIAIYDKNGDIFAVGSVDLEGIH